MCRDPCHHCIPNFDRESNLFQNSYEGHRHFVSKMITLLFFIHLNRKCSNFPMTYEAGNLLPRLNDYVLKRKKNVHLDGAYIVKFAKMESQVSPSKWLRPCRKQHRWRVLRRQIVEWAMSSYFLLDLIWAGAWPPKSNLYARWRVPRMASYMLSMCLKFLQVKVWSPDYQSLYPSGPNILSGALS